MNKLAKARDKWLNSDEGKKCFEGGASGEFLRNRIELAFIAGWNACEKENKPPRNANKPIKF